ncbi:hypothetical protein [Polaromonas sp. YR568]|uniref:hypothetical protein n=1 Tax=Polaromonas sp. YR568 TaxID=1855301 RepID=UPI00398C0D49
MSARDSFAIHALFKGIGARVLLAGFNELEVDVLRSRLQMAAPLTPVARVDSTTLPGAPSAIEAFRHHLVFIRLCDRHMHADFAAMDDFLAQMAELQTAAVIPVASRRAAVDFFRHHLSSISPLYLGAHFAQDDLLHILDTYGFSRSTARSRRISSVHA